MERETISEWLKRRPFQPFLVHLADGRTFEIRHPQSNLLAQSFIKIGVPEPGNTDPESCDHTEYVLLTQIARLEPLSFASPTQA